MTATSSKVEGARAWLLAQLSDGQPHVAGGLIIAGGLAGHAENTLRRVAHNLKVKQSSAAYGAERKAAQVTIWQLPKKQ